MYILHLALISNLPQFISMHPKSKKENNSDKHWTDSLHI